MPSLLIKLLEFNTKKKLFIQLFQLLLDSHDFLKIFHLINYLSF